MQQPNKVFLVLVTIIATLSGLLWGFDMAVISGVIPLVKDQYNLSAAMEGWFVSAALGGAVLGVVFSGEISDRLGRRVALILAGILFTISAIGCAWAPTMTLLVIARIIGGIGVGIGSNVSPLYISEISPANVRGRLVTMFQLAITVGILIAYFSNAGLLGYSNAHEASSASFFNLVFIEEVWRGMLGIETIPALLFVLGLLFVPESPRWLIYQGREKEAKKTLYKIEGEEKVNKEVEEIKGSLNQEQGSYKELFAPGMKLALLIGILLPVFSQFSGINAVIYYGPRILNDAGLSMEGALNSQILLGVFNMLFTFVAIWKVDQMGRRPLYLVGSLGAAITLFITGVFFFYGATTNVFLLITVILFLGFFAFSLGPLKFVVASEIFPNKIRGRALGISIFTMWVTDYIMSVLTPILLEGVGTSGTFWLFSLVCIIAFIVIYRIVPETKGKSLEEIQRMWMGDKVEEHSKY